MYCATSMIYSFTVKPRRSLAPRAYPEIISRVLEVLQEKKLFAKGSKCEFMLPSVTFLGFTVAKGM